MRTGTRLGFAALILALVTASAWIYNIRQVNIPEDRTLFVVAFLAAALLGIAAYFKKTGLAGGVAAAIAIFIGSLLPFTVAISPQQVATGAIAVGDTIPHFTAVDGRGETFDSDSLHGHLVLIKFFRAHW